MNEERTLETLSSHIIKGNFETTVQEKGVEASSQPGASEQIRQLVKNNVKPSRISDAVLDRSMKTSIQKYFKNEFLLPDLIDRAKSIGKARDVLAESTEDTSPCPKGKAVLATINSVGPAYWRDTAKVLLKGLGFNAIDLGNQISTSQVIQSIKKEKPKVLGISVPTVYIFPDANTIQPASVTSKVKKIIQELSEKGYRENITVMVGGHIPGIKSASALGSDYYCINFYQTVAALDLFVSLQTLRDKFGILLTDTLTEYNRLNKFVANL